MTALMAVSVPPKTASSAKPSGWEAPRRAPEPISYDPADRLTQALANPGGTYAYTLDAADNLLGQQTPTGAASSTYNALNQIDQRNGQPVTHDAAGNLTDDGTRTYAWDAQQRLVRIGHTGTGLDKILQKGFHNALSSMTLNLNQVLSGIRVRGLHPEGNYLIEKGLLSQLVNRPGVDMTRFKLVRWWGSGPDLAEEREGLLS